MGVTHRVRKGTARRSSVEPLEPRTLLAANLHITAALLVDGNNAPITAPATGQQVHIRAQWTTTDLTSANQYVVRYYVDGVALDSATLTGQAGVNLANSWYRSGWCASPGTHSVQVTIDGANAVAESDESDNTMMFSFSPVAPASLPQKFVTPIRGAQGQDWTIVNYLDVDPRSGSSADYLGGPFQYDGHGGIDLTLANFAQMDGSVSVLAAAAGTVTAVVDGYFDRETASNNNQYNYVQITHGNGWKTEYIHLAANTIVVKVGEVVVGGQLLGLVGSSGSSTDAHLHFQVFHDNALVETYYDPSGYWLNPLPYEGSTPAQVMDSGITNYTVWPDFKERPSGVDTFPTSTTWSVWFWNRFSHLNAGDAVQIRWYRPGGILNTTSNYTAPGIVRYGQYAWTLPRAVWGAFPGTWEVALTVNGVEKSRRSFQVTSGAGAPEMKLYQGSTFIIDGRTTGIDFGFADVGGTPAPLTFTVQNHGSAALSLSGLALPPGFSLVDALPSSVAPDGSASFTLQLDSLRGGAKFGQVALSTNDTDEELFTFNVKGTVTGALPGGAPNLVLPGPAVPFSPGAAPPLIDAAAVLTDSDSTNFAGGQLVVQMAGFISADDRLGVRNQGSGAGQIGVNGADVTYGGVAIGTLSGGSGAAPLVLILNANATVAATQALVRNLTFGSVAAFPPAVRRYLRVALTDDTGKLSTQPVKTVAFDTVSSAQVPFAWMNGSRLNVRFEGSAGMPITLASAGGNDSATRGAETLTFAGASEIVVFGTAAGDFLRIDAPLGRPLTFENGAGSDDTVEVSSGTYTFAGDLSPALQNVGVSVAAPASAVFTSSQHLASLAVAGAASVTSGAATVLVTKAISVTGQLDLGTATLIVDYSGPSPAGSWDGTAYTGVTGLLAAGRNGGAWNGSGIVTTSASGNLTTLGVEEINGDVVVKFTYGGDANLDGKINVDDYGHINSSIPIGLTGWINGDFNYDGKINVDDYGIIDFNIGIQGPPLGGASPVVVPQMVAKAPSATWVQRPLREEGTVDEEENAAAELLA